MSERPWPRGILMTVDAVGGVFTYALRLGSLLATRGSEVHLATMGPRPNDAQREAAEHAGLRVHESDYRLEWMGEPWADVDEAANWLRELERQIEPDIVHLNGYCHGACPWRSPVVVVAHSCVLSWWRAVRKEAAPIEWSEYRDRVTRGLHAADIVIAPTRAMLACIEAEYGAPAASVVIQHAGDAAAFKPAPKEPFVLAAGRTWDEAKNITALDRVADKLQWPVVVAGCRQSPGERRGAATRALQFLGELAQPELARSMGRAAIYALPARYEPFGLSVLEAALSGCALVLGDIPSLRELWADAALFVSPDDHEGLEVALKTLIVDEAKLRRLAERARSRALRLEPERMLNAYLRAYEAAAARAAKTLSPVRYGGNSREEGGSCA